MLVAWIPYHPLHHEHATSLMKKNMKRKCKRHLVDSKTMDVHQHNPHKRNPTLKLSRLSAVFRPTRRTLSVSSVAILVLGSVVFALLAKTGARLLDNLERREKAAVERDNNGEEKITAAGGALPSGYDAQHAMYGAAGTNTSTGTNGPQPAVSAV